MACFLIPMFFGIWTHAMRKKLPAKWHFNWLNIMLWGGVVGLALEHIAHKEIVFYPPFLTAMSSWSDTMIMLQEMAIVGTGMFLSIVVIWFLMVVVYNKYTEKSRVKNVSV